MLTDELEFEHTAVSAGIIGAAAIAGALAGFFLQLLVAYFFGADQDTDAFFMAQSTSELLGKLLMGGSITAVFIPMFVERIARQKRDAWELALNLLHLTGVVFVVAIILLGVFTRPFVHFIAPGFDPVTADLTVRLLRLLLPSFLLLFLVELSTAMLQSLRQFALPASLRLVAPLISIISILVLAPSIGIYALALGIVIGSAVQLGVMGWGLYRQGFRYQFIFRPSDAAVKRLLYLVFPFIFSVLATQAAGIAYRILVSDLPSGSLAALKFAEKISQLLTIMFLTSVTTVIYPLLSEKASRHDFAGMRQTLGSAIRLITFATLPVLVGVILLREPLIRFLYQRGSFNPEDAAMTSIALLFLIVGLTANGISSVLGHATLALQRTRAAVVVAIISQIIAIILFLLLTPPLAHAGLALTSSLVPIAIAIMYFLYLSRYIPRLHHVFWHSMYVKTGALTILLALAVTFLRSTTNNLPTILQLIIPTVVGAAVYFYGAHLWGISEMRQLSAIAKQKINRLYALRRH